MVYKTELYDIFNNLNVIEIKFDYNTRISYFYKQHIIIKYSTIYLNKNTIIIDKDYSIEHNNNKIQFNNLCDLCNYLKSYEINPLYYGIFVMMNNNKDIDYIKNFLYQSFHINMYKHQTNDIRVITEEYQYDSIEYHIYSGELNSNMVVYNKDSTMVKFNKKEFNTKDELINEMILLYPVLLSYIRNEKIINLLNQ